MAVDSFRISHIFEHDFANLEWTLPEAKFEDFDVFALGDCISSVLSWISNVHLLLNHLLTPIFDSKQPLSKEDL